MIFLMMFTACHVQREEKGSNLSDSSQTLAPATKTPEQQLFSKTTVSTPVESDKNGVKDDSNNQSVPTPKISLHKNEPTTVPKQAQPDALHTPQELKSYAAISIIGLNDNIILSRTEVPYKEGMNAFDILLISAQNANITLKTSGFGTMIYVKSINGLSEFDNGPMSGWLYFVNDKKQDVGAGSCKLKSGDKVLWKYTIDGIR